MNTDSAALRIVESTLAADKSEDSIDLRFSVLMLAVYSASIFFIHTWYGLLLFLILQIPFAICLRRRISSNRTFLKIGLPVYALLIFTVIFNMFIWNGNELEFQMEGLLNGLFYAFRILLILSAGILFCLSIRLDRIEYAIARILRPLNRFGLNTDDISIACSIALKSVPQAIRQYKSIRDAQWSRSAKLDSGSLIQRVKAHFRIFIPLLISLFRNADRLSYAMEIRCYGSVSGRRTWLYEEEPSNKGIILCMVICALCIACAMMLWWTYCHYL